MAEFRSNTASTGDKQRGKEPVEFTFDARNKSIVTGIFAIEAKNLKRFFARKPKVSLHQMETSLNNSAGEAELRKFIPQFTAYYVKNSDSGHRYLESLGRLLLEAASKEKENGERQWFLILQALETLEGAIQRSPKVLNVPSQSLVVSIYRILGAPYYDTYNTERDIHKEMMTMLNVKKDPNDFTSRERIIKLYLQERNYYSALVHTAEYEKIMQAKSRSLYRQKQGELAFRKASIFQAMIDFYQKTTLGQGEAETNKLAELAKLSGFITRFNRDNRRVNIVPLKSMDVFAVNKTIASMVAIANTFYRDAGKSEYFGGRHKAYFFMARNNWQFDNPKGAQSNIAEAVRLVDLSRMPAKQKAGEKIKLLEFMHRIYVDLGHQRKAEDTSQQLARMRKEAGMTGLAASA